MCAFWADKSGEDFIQSTNESLTICTLTISYFNLTGREELWSYTAGTPYAKNAHAGMRSGNLMAKMQFRNNDTSGESRSIRMMVQVQCGRCVPAAACKVAFVCL